MCNYRHPGPRRAWEVGSEPAFLIPLRPLRSGRSGRSRREFQKRRFCCYVRYFSACEVPKSGLPPNRTPTWTPWGPRRSKWIPKVLQDGQWESTGWSNGDPKPPNRNQKVTKVAPKASLGDPSGGPRWPKGAPRAQLYVQTPDQPPERPLCYEQACRCGE